MTLKGLSDIVSCGIKVHDAHNGKVLCRAYYPEKQTNLADREVLSIWTEINVKNSGFDSFARPVLCVYVAHLDGAAKDGAENG